MKRRWQRRLFTGVLAMTIMATNSSAVFAGAVPDGKTDAAAMAESMGKTDAWNAWVEEWETVKTDWTQISLTPGSDESQLNFTWYSKKTEGAAAPVMKLSENQDMSGAAEYTAAQTEVLNEADEEGNTYYSNKVTAVGLKSNTTYYYSYQKEDGSYTEAEAYTTRNSDSFCFIFVGDPQIGSSNEEKAKKPEDIAKETFKTAQSESVRSDAFNWETTLEQAMKMSGNQAGFVVSAGDQIQTNAKKVESKTVSEIEYAGYLSPDILKSLPVATTVGNHDADNENYTYHFNTPNNSTLGSNGIVGGDYWFTYGSVLFMMLNTQDTNVAEHKQFMEQAVAANRDCKWRVVTLHQDIYGSAEHSNEPEITTLRYQLIPYFEENDVDVVLTGHDHAYSRSKMLLNGTQSDLAAAYTDDEFDEQLDKDIDAGDDSQTRYTAPGNIQDDTTDPEEQKYLSYLKSIMDEDAIDEMNAQSATVVNPDGILYMTANSSSGSKYYDLVPRMQSYIAGRWQEDVPTYSIVKVDDSTLSISTYRTDNNEKIDETFTIAKENVNKSELQKMVEEALAKEAAAKDSYTAESYQIFEEALKGAQTVLEDNKTTRAEIKSAFRALVNAKGALVLKADKTKLQALVTEAEKLAAQKDGYTAESYRAFETALAAAKTALADENAKTAETEEALERLSGAKAALVKRISISKAKISAIRTQTYTGKAIRPSVTVKVNNKTLKLNTEYTVSYANNKNTGKATVTIKGVGAYTGTKKTLFKIAPKKAEVKSLKAAGKNKAAVTIRKSAGKVSGYEIRYAANSKFSKAKTKTTTKTTCKLSSLTSGKTCYVKVRAYKTVSGKKIYGTYSKTIKVKVK